MYTVYHDTSGSQNDAKGSLVAVALMSSVGEWASYESAWEAMLAYYGMPDLHMRRLFGRNAGYPSLRGDHYKAQEVLNAAVRIIGSWVEEPLSISVDLRGYCEVNSEYHLDRGYAGAYAWAASQCIIASQQWLNDRHPGEPVDHRIEKGDTGQGGLVKVFKSNDRYSVTAVARVNPATGASVRQFEASDLVAWFSHRILHDQMLTSQNRETVYRLRHAIGFKDHNFTAGALRRVCEAYPDIFPRRSPTTRTDGLARRC